MISYTTKPDGVREICSVSLIDTEEAAKVKKGEAAWFQVGNVLWRSPEAQAGVRVAKPSDIWSFGVTVSAFPSILHPSFPSTCPFQDFH